MQPTASNPGGGSPSAEQRRYPRYTVNLDALVTGGGFESHACKIRDFCVAGMFLSFEGQAEPASSSPSPIAAGDDINIHFFLNLHGHDRAFDMSGQVARVLASGVGIALQNPDPATIEALMQAAKASSAAEARDRTRQIDARRQPADFDRARLLTSVRQIVRQHLGGYLTAFFRKAEEQLFLASREAKNNLDQRRLWDAISALKARKADLDRDISEALFDQYDGMVKPTAKPSPPQRREPSLSELSLVQTHEFEEFLAVTEAIDRCETFYTGRLHELEQRLSFLWGVKIDKVNNPIGPGAVARAFCDTLQKLKFDLDVLRLVFQSYFEAVVPELARMYEQVGEELKKQGVPLFTEPLPPRRPRPSERPRPAAPAGPAVPPAGSPQPVPAFTPVEGFPTLNDPDAQVAPATPGYYPRAPMPPTAGAAPGGAVPPPGGYVVAGPGVAPVPGGAGVGAPVYPPNVPWVPSAVPQGVPTSLPPGMMPAGGVGAPGQAQPAGAVPQPAAVPMGMPVVGTVQAAHTLLGLRRQLQTAMPVAAPAAGRPGAVAPGGEGAAPTGAAPPATAAPARPPVAYYNPGELASALQSVDYAAVERSQGLDAQQFRSELETALARQAPGTSPKNVSDQDWDVLELVVELFNAILTDARVINEIKPQIRRLRTPVNQLALTEPAFFESQNHPARQVLNRLAEIRSVVGTDPKNPIGPRIDALLGKVSAEAASRPAVFHEAAAELEKIAAEQEQAYSENVAHLSKAAEEQQQFLKARRKATGGHEPRHAAPGAGLLGEWGEWLNRARRLKVGDELELSSGSQKQRVSVAWVGEDQSSYLFADSIGNKVANVGQQELAMQLRRGSARVLEKMNLPAVDRALYTSLQSLHGRLEQQAASDQLTSLTNEKAFRDELEGAVTHAQRDSVSHVLAYLRLDQYDVLKGDADEETLSTVLRETARRLRTELGSEAVLARLADDRFGILLRDVSQGQAFERIERARIAIAASPIVTVAEELPVTAGVGMAPFAADVFAVASVTRAAESALEFARKAGGNTTRIHHVEEGEQAGIRSREILGEKLGKALETGALQLAAHRIVPQRQDAALPTHLELMPLLMLDAGIRVEPAALRRAAELMKRSVDVDRWMIRTAMKWIVDHPDRLPVNGLCVIQLSASSLNDTGLAGFITEELINTAVPPARLCFELSDTSGLGRRSDADELVHSLREFGCRFVFGDFGSEQSSFARVKDMQIDFVRIGRMGGRDIVNDRADAALVKSVVEMAHFLGVPAIADCIDTEAALAKVRELGVEYAQGSAVSAIEIPQ